MQYTTIVEHSEEGLNLICEKALSFDRESVLDGIIIRKYTVYDIEQMIVDVQEYHAKLMREINSVVKFSLVFNKHFETDNNKCFEIAERLFRKIRSSVSGTKRIYRNFCKTIRKQYPGVSGPQKASVFTHSILTSGTFNRDLFGESAFPKVIKQLCDEMESFFSDLVQIIMVCQDVTAKEKILYDDPESLNALYMLDTKLTRNRQQYVVAQMKENHMAPSIDPMTKLKKSKNFADFLRAAFHKFNLNELTVHVVNEELEKGLNDGLDADEALYWPNNHELVPKIRILIAHFDEIDPKGQFCKKEGKYKLSGKMMAYLVKWCQLEGSGYESNFIEGYFKNHYHGQFLTIIANSQNAAKNNKTKKKNGADKPVKLEDIEYPKFVLKVENLISKYMTN